jgi:kinesin family member 18/19
MSEHITVAVRIRPLDASEKQPKKKRRQTLLDIPTANQDLDRTLSVLDEKVILFGMLHLIDSQKRDGKRQYAFDVVLDENSTQVQVFEQTSKPLIKHVLQGYNATVFAYGATGQIYLFRMWKDIYHHWH